MCLMLACNHLHLHIILTGHMCIFACFLQYGHSIVKLDKSTYLTIHLSYKDSQAHQTGPCPLICGMFTLQLLKARQKYICNLSMGKLVSSRQ